MNTEFCVEAVEEALARYGPPEIFNTDQGSQFTSEALHRTAQGQRDQRQHGRQGQLEGQRVRRASLEEPQVRGGLSEGIWIGLRSKDQHRPIFSVLQFPAAPFKPRRNETPDEFYARRLPEDRAAQFTAAWFHLSNRSKLSRQPGPPLKDGGHLSISLNPNPRLECSVMASSPHRS